MYNKQDEQKYKTVHLSWVKENKKKKETLQRPHILRAPLPENPNMRNAKFSA
jgi:hypothetical protein